MGLGRPLIQLKTSADLGADKKLNPKIMWPSINYENRSNDLEYFPNFDLQNYCNKNGGSGIFSNQFQDAMLNAQNHIFIIDSYILKPSSEHSDFLIHFKTCIELTEAKLVRIISSKPKNYVEQFNKYNSIEQEKRRVNGQKRDFEISCKYIKKSTFRMPHDRFAIVDDELWHWGANVGGTHHEVNAFSRGWSAARTNAHEFFNTLWANAEELNK